MGRVLLAELDDDRVADVFGRSRRDAVTEHTVRDLDGLLDAIGAVRRRGWSMVDQELELGVRSVAAPIHNATGCTVAAVNVSTHVGRTDLDVLVDDFVPALLATAAQIDSALGMR
jgi:IclR family transcriptional regulator, pca regulon regulatory protein